jgi:NTE family protein
MGFLSWLQKKPNHIGLALSGGALHGAAHIGVLKVLEREGICPSIVAGTSVGAIIGAAYAAGVSAEDMSIMFRKASWPDLVKISFHNSLSFFNTQPLEEFIKSKIGNFTFETLPRKFAVVTCDLMTGERIVLDKGPVGPAVRASAAFPMLLSPIVKEDCLFVDGGVVDNLPAGQVKDMGADYIIGVDLSTSTQLTDKPSNIMEIALSVMNLMQIRAAFQDVALIDCHIRPKVSDLSMWSFGDSDELENRGQAAAELVIDQLRKDLGRQK